jgi:hypothetical protein
MITKEEILDKTHWDFVCEKGLISIRTKTFPSAYKEQAIIAMDIFSKQESRREATEFTEWVNKDYRKVVYPDIGTRYYRYMDGMKTRQEKPPLSIDELYELYTKQKPNSPVATVD